MSNLVLFYSLGGHAKRLASEYAAQNGFELREIVPQKPIGKFRAFTLCLKAMSGKEAPIRELGELAGFERYHVFAPIWAGSPAPPIYAALNKLPQGAEVALTLCSSSGESARPLKIRSDLNVVSITDVKKPKKERN